MNDYTILKEFKNLDKRFKFYKFNKVDLQYYQFILENN